MVLGHVLVGEIALDGSGKMEVVDLARLESLLADVLADRPPAEIHQGQRPG